jgi:hypothetical protein
MVVDEHEAKHTATGIGHSLTLGARSPPCAYAANHPPDHPWG